MKETKANIVKKSEGSPVQNPNELKWWQRAGMRLKNWWDSLEPSDKAYAGTAIFVGITAVVGGCFFFHDTTEHGYRIDLDLSKKIFSYRPSDSDDDDMES